MNRERTRPRWWLCALVGVDAAVVAVLPPTYTLLEIVLTPPPGDVTAAIFVAYPAPTTRLLGVVLAVAVSVVLCASWRWLRGSAIVKAVAVVFAVAIVAGAVRAAGLSRVTEANEAARLWMAGSTVAVGAVVGLLWDRTRPARRSR